MIAASLDGKMVNVCVCIPISTPTLSGLRNFFEQESHRPPTPPFFICTDTDTETDTDTDMFIWSLVQVHRLFPNK